MLNGLVFPVVNSLTSSPNIARTQFRIFSLFRRTFPRSEERRDIPGLPFVIDARSIYCSYSTILSMWDSNFKTSQSSRINLGGASFRSGWVPVVVHLPWVGGTPSPNPFRVSNIKKGSGMHENRNRETKLCQKTHDALFSGYRWRSVLKLAQPLSVAMVREWKRSSQWKRTALAHRT